MLSLSLWPTVSAHPDLSSGFLCPTLYPREADTSDYHAESFCCLDSRWVWIMGGSSWRPEGERREKSTHLLPTSMPPRPLCSRPHLVGMTVPLRLASLFHISRCLWALFLLLAFSNVWGGSGFSLLMISRLSIPLAGSFNFVHVCIDYLSIHLCVAFCGSSIFNFLSHSIHQKAQLVLL